MKVLNIPIKDIVQRENSRSNYKTMDLHDLMSSLKKDGLLHPIGVREVKGGKFEVVFGNRRLLAAQKLGWDEIPAQVVAAETDHERDTLNLIENIKRAEITAYDEGRIFLKWFEEGLSLDEIGARVGIPTLRVKNSINVASDVPAEHREKIVPVLLGDRKSKKGQMASSMAAHLLSVSREASLNKAEIKNLFDRGIRDQITKKQATALGGLMSRGLKFDEAYANLGKVVSVSVNFVVNESTKKRIEKKYGMSYNKVILEFLIRHREFGIKTNVNASRVIRRRPVEKR